MYPVLPSVKDLTLNSRSQGKLSDSQGKSNKL